MQWLPLAQQMEGFVGDWDIAGVHDSSETVEVDLSTMGFITTLEEWFYQNSVDFDVISDFNQYLMKPLNLSLSQTILRIQECRNFVWIDLVKRVLFEARSCKNQINIIDEPHILDLVWVSRVFVYPLDSLGFVRSELDSSQTGFYFSLSMEPKNLLTVMLPFLSPSKS